MHIPKKRIHLQSLYEKLNNDNQNRLFLTILDVLPLTAEQCEVLVDEFTRERNPERRQQTFINVADKYNMNVGAIEADIPHEEEEPRRRRYPKRRWFRGFS